MGAVDNTTTNTTSPPRPASHHIILNAAPWQMAALVGTNLVFAVAYAVITVGTYRVARKLPPFILFLSEALANVYTLTLLVFSFGGQLFHTHPLGDQVTAMILCSLTVYASQLHYLLIAVNRGFAIFFPLQYDYWWRRSRVIASVVAIWVVGTTLELAFLVHYARVRNAALWLGIYRYVQSAVTMPSLAIYTVVLGWVLLSRMLQWLKKRRVIADISNSTQNPSIDYAHTIDLQIFAYCFLSFLPNCYNMVIQPQRNSLHQQFYAITRISSNALLLYVMSSALREQVPGATRLHSLARAISHLLYRFFPTASSVQHGNRNGSIIKKGNIANGRQRMQLPTPRREVVSAVARLPRVQQCWQQQSENKWMSRQNRQHNTQIPPNLTANLRN